MLYKARLPRIAEYIDTHEIEELNMIASSPSQLLDMPIRLIRIIERSDYGKTFLSKPEERQYINSVYKKYHTYLNKEEWVSDSQIMYLMDIYDNDRKFNRKTYEFIGDFLYDEDEYTQYQYFLMARDMIREYFDFDVNYSDCDYFWYKCDLVDEFNKILEHEEKLDRRFQDLAKKHEELCYEDETYKVVLPTSVMDIFKEAYYQRNCLLDYIKPVANEKSIILFIRRKQDIDFPYITVEIDPTLEYIVQMRGKNNRELNEKEQIFMKKYCKLKSIEGEWI